MNGRSFVLPSESQLVVLTVHGNVFSMSGAKFVDGGDNREYAALAIDWGLSHIFRREIAVHAGAVPISLSDRLGMDRGNDVELLAYTI